MGNISQVTLKLIPDNFTAFCTDTAANTDLIAAKPEIFSTTADGTATLRSLQGTTTSFKPRASATVQQQQEMLHMQPVYKIMSKI